MSSRLTLHFLGTPQLFLDNKPINAERRKAVALLAYLAVSKAAHTREFLSALLWPDYEQSKAFTNLRHTLWEIQQAVGEGWLDADREKIGLKKEADIWLDVAHFKSMLGQSRTQKDISQRIPLLVDAAKLYRNHFLTGFSLKDASPFNEWAFAEGEELRRNLADALNTLSEDYIMQGEAEKAIPYARRLIALDPLNESAHRCLMEVYLQAGQHSAALKQYQTCEQILRKELGLDPQPETLALYKKIRKGQIKPAQIESQIETNTRKHNLPSLFSTFIGREKEQAEVINLVAKNRLVTLLGIGGIGKTSLSLQTGQELLKDYPDGIWFIALEALNDPALVPQTVAAVFEIRESNDQSSIEILTNKLRERTVLLILDNCEHVVDACAQLSTTLLTNCPKLKILATSREMINVAGEATYQMPPLSMPEQNEASLEKLTEYESIKLFTERASLAFSSFVLTNENARTVMDICRKVDGIPLAIELAAAHVNILQVSEILNQLQSSFALLSTDNRTTLSHHQTLRASLDWSWGLLNEAEQKFMRQLAVFAGGWTLESAQAVCDGDVLGLTSALVKKSLIVVDQESGHVTRYRFHEIVHQYTREKLLVSGEEASIRSLHLKYFLKLSELAEPAFHGPQQLEWFTRVNDERSNIRVALEQASRMDLEAGSYLTGRLIHYWINFDLREGLSWTTEFVQKTDPKIHSHGRAKALLAHGNILWYLQQFDAAHSAADECIALFRACGDRQGEIDGMMLKGIIMQHLEGMEQKIEFHKQALALAQSIGDIWRQAIALSALGWDQRDPQRSRACWEKANTIFRQVGDWRNLAFTLSILGYTVLSSGEIESAQKLLDESLALNRRMNDRNGMEFVLTAKSQMALMNGEYEQARTFLQEWVVLAEEMGNRMGRLWARARLGYVTLREGNVAEAQRILVEALEAFQKDRNKSGLAFVFDKLASLYVAIDKAEYAAHLIGWSDTTRKEIGNPRPRLEQVDVDRDIETIREKIGSATFEVACNSGRKMALDEVIAFVLDGS